MFLCSAHLNGRLVWEPERYEGGGPICDLGVKPACSFCQLFLDLRK